MYYSQGNDDFIKCANDVWGRVRGSAPLFGRSAHVSHSVGMSAPRQRVTFRGLRYVRLEAVSAVMIGRAEVEGHAGAIQGAIQVEMVRDYRQIVQYGNSGGVKSGGGCSMVRLR